ncbi:MAG: cytochrome d ubiquinol oxidase subunit II [Prevotella sp.]|nr:cytochrome d ubiquinol oxidase subunit II [Prevotella sp.]
MTYLFLQQYWWCVVSLLGALLVFLLFVQGANSMIFSLGRTADERRLVVNSTGRKWEFTFTTLVTFGGAFFASFPLFYSTSFGGAYWLWMLILFTFVLQAVSYEFQNKMGHLLGTRTFQWFLIVNGVAGPLLLGGAVATFFNGSNFLIEKGNLLPWTDGLPAATGTTAGVISGWANASHGLDALLDAWNLVLGLAVFFLARTLGLLYIINNVRHDALEQRARRLLPTTAAAFVVCFVAFLVRTLTKDGFAYDASGTIFMQPMKYMDNFLAMPLLAALLLAGVVLVLYGICKTVVKPRYVRGIWPAGIGTVLAVFALIASVGLNGTAYYPSTADMQSSLTIENSCSSLFTLSTMFYVSLLVPFVLAYIVYAWRAIDSHKLTMEELSQGEAY